MDVIEEAQVAIVDFHAHIYFDPAALDLAKSLAAAASERFGVAIGRFHPQAVGPHPRGSCQLTVANDQFGPVIQWLALNRRGLTIFAHPNTGDGLADHTDHVIWLGPSETLQLGIFKAP